MPYAKSEKEFQILVGLRDDIGENDQAHRAAWVNTFSACAINALARHKNQCDDPPRASDVFMLMNRLGMGESMAKEVIDLVSAKIEFTVLAVTIFGKSDESGSTRSYSDFELYV